MISDDSLLTIVFVLRSYSTGTVTRPVYHVHQVYTAARPD